MGLIKFLKSKFSKNKLRSSSFPVSFHQATRSEKVGILILVDITKGNKAFLQEVIAALNISPKCMTEGDILQIDYSFGIEYLDGINKKFDLIMDLISRKDVKVESILYAELNHGKILIQEILNKMDKISLNVSKRKGRDSHGRSK